MKRGGDKPAEGIYYEQLIDMAIKEKDWHSAAAYIDRYTALESGLSGGYWATRAAPIGLIERNSRWSLSYLRLQQYEKAGGLLIQAYGNLGKSERVLRESGLDRAVGIDSNKSATLSTTRRRPVPRSPPLYVQCSASRRLENRFNPKSTWTLTCGRSQHEKL
ncbi:hypothetical protein P152DRAFT_157864 [Eremomyces bilateralis CBS 781.70]|uniref:Uncharacterized protein n=1 Tax=Eremomyces bilateralis CBS 781.70 TaxID=1392243 RepID=A0A6G1FUY2_9PEZI|nr:uncharacterized protein P152DRAFT_157864 [Eremomyces bilateralis CBS 781.70]KAF1809459.1 hypothetical protein P152DRAFT_157864 [Eremomyces bilateralis CBS 781.70]